MRKFRKQDVVIAENGKGGVIIDVIWDDFYLVLLSDYSKVAFAGNQLCHVNTSTLKQ